MGFPNDVWRNMPILSEFQEADFLFKLP